MGSEIWSNCFILHTYSIEFFPLKAANASLRSGPHCMQMGMRGGRIKEWLYCGEIPQTPQGHLDKAIVGRMHNPLWLYIDTTVWALRHACSLHHKVAITFVIVTSNIQ